MGFRLVIAMLLAAAPACQAAPLAIVAAEGVYADVARQVAGPDAVVAAILTNPASDPHMFEPAPSVARAVAGAAIVIENGIGYDPWMARLVSVSPRPAGSVIVVAALLHRQPGDNPHLWYDPAALPAVAEAVYAQLCRDDPSAQAGLAERLRGTLAAFAVLNQRIAALHAKFAGMKVAATEPVFGPMLAALGLVDLHPRFGLAVMNGTEPRAGDVAAMEEDLRAHRARALITNSQASDPAALRLAAIAREAGIAVVGITETLPQGQSAQAWIGGELASLEAALAAPHS
jgi:zinc/manganese transport system substrate-binding protein